MITEANVTTLLIGAFIVEVLISIWAFIDIRRIYIEEQGWQSLLFRVVVRLCGIAVLVGVAFVPVAVVSLLDLPRLPFTGIGITIGVMVLIGAVIVYWRVFKRIRDRGKKVKSTVVK